MQYVISILIATVIAALAGWLVQRDSHQKSLTILTVAVIVAFSVVATGALNYVAKHPSNILNWMINGEESFFRIFPEKAMRIWRENG